MAKHRLREKENRPSPEQWSAAIKQAQTSLETPAQPGQQVKLKAQELKTRTDLFQPRTFYMGLFDLDKEFVKKLEREIRIRDGELDPILVIRLGSHWTVLDGHHRLEAYRNLGRKEIVCVWFGGSVREAVDKSVELNSVIKLPLAQPDKFEQAWRRVVLGWGSKSQIVKLCGVSDGMVGKMRRVVALYHDNSDASKLLRKRLQGSPVATVSWSEAHAAYLDLDPKGETDKQAQAAKLAKRMHSSLGSRLSSDPEITAKALSIYDPDLPAPLLKSLAEEVRGGDNELSDDTEGGEDRPRIGRPLNELAEGLRLVREQRAKVMEELEKQEQDFLAEIERRKAAGETPSDATWAEWVAPDKPANNN